MPDTLNIQNYLEANLERYLEILRRMVEINSFTANPAGVNELGKYSASLFEPWGFQTEYVQSIDSNFGQHLFLNKKAATGDGKHQPHSVALVSHLDTVFPPEEEIRNNFTWQREDKRVYGPGTVDIKGGTLLIYMMLEVIRKFEPQVFEKNNWLIYLDASEEHLSKDFADLCLQRIPRDCEACLVFEGGAISNGDFLLVTARKGRAAFRVSVEGRSAHAGNNHAQGANAIVQMALTIQKIASLTDYDRDLTFNVGKVDGGVVVNRVPHRAEALVEMRTFDPQVFEDGKSRMLALAGVSDITSQDGYSCTVRIEVLDESEPWPHNEATEGLYNIWKEAANQLGMSVRAEQRGGLSDGNFMWQHVPVLDGLGPAGNNAHCSERDPASAKEQEYAIIPSFVPKTLMNTVAVLKLVRAPKNAPDPVST